MDVVSVAMEMDTGATDDLAKGEEVDDEKEGTKHRTLGDALGQGSSCGGAVVDVDELFSVSEVGV